jgi:chromosome segregation ATPase
VANTLKDRVEELEDKSDNLDRETENIEIRVQSLEEQQQVVLERIAMYKEAEGRIEGGFTALKWMAGILTFLATLGHCIPIDY